MLREERLEEAEDAAAAAAAAAAASGAIPTADGMAVERSWGMGRWIGLLVSVPQGW